jgi:hypothetical protein
MPKPALPLLSGMARLGPALRLREADQGDPGKPHRGASVKKFVPDLARATARTYICSIVPRPPPVPPKRGTKGAPVLELIENPPVGALRKLPGLRRWHNTEAIAVVQR